MISDSRQMSDTFVSAGEWRGWWDIFSSPNNYQRKIKIKREEASQRSIISIRIIFKINPSIRQRSTSLGVTELGHKSSTLVYKQILCLPSLEAILGEPMIRFVMWKCKRCRVFWTFKIHLFFLLLPHPFSLLNVTAVIVAINSPYLSRTSAVSQFDATVAKDLVLLTFEVRENVINIVILCFNRSVYYIRLAWIGSTQVSYRPDKKSPYFPSPLG